MNYNNNNNNNNSLRAEHARYYNGDFDEHHARVEGSRTVEAVV